MQNLARF